MFFKKTRCPNCDGLHDEMLDYCPFCGVRNEVNAEFKKRHPLSLFPWYWELYFFLLGLLGFVLFNLIFSIAFRSIYNEDPDRGLMLINSLSYLAFFLMVAVVIVPNRGYRKDIFSKFKIGTAYMWAGIGFAALIGFSITYNIFVQIFFPETGEGGNQTAVVDMVTNYPLISLLIVGIIGPICEEVAYRVGLFTFLRRIHPSVAYIGTAIVFGLIHFDFSSSDMLTEVVYLQNYIFAGLCFSFVYDKKGFAASTFAHISNNVFSILLTLMSSQIV